MYALWQGQIGKRMSNNLHLFEFFKRLKSLIGIYIDSIKVSNAKLVIINLVIGLVLEQSSAAVCI